MNYILRELKMAAAFGGFVLACFGVGYINYSSGKTPELEAREQLEKLRKAALVKIARADGKEGISSADLEGFINAVGMPQDVDRTAESIVNSMPDEALKSYLGK